MKYRKKPVVIEAVEWDGKDIHQTERPDWFRAAVDSGVISQLRPDRPLIIHTMEGVLLAREGDMIIRGVKGEIYPCRPDIFEATYEGADGGLGYSREGDIVTVRLTRDDFDYLVLCLGHAAAVNPELSDRVANAVNAGRPLSEWRPYAG